jgi:hypothetical protein
VSESKTIIIKVSSMDHLFVTQDEPFCHLHLCGLQDESFLHYIWDCKFSCNLWNHIGFNNLNFFLNLDVYDWLKLGVIGSHTLIFLAGHTLCIKITYEEYEIGITY